MNFKLDPNGILITNVNAYKPPLVKIDKLLDEISKKFSIKFESFSGYNDERKIFIKFSNDVELSEDKYEAIEEYLQRKLKV